MNLTALYAGSFDPVTDGHLWMIRTAAEMVGSGKLIVAIGQQGANPDKRYTFTYEERLGFLQEAVKHEPKFLKVEFVQLGSEYLVHLARKFGAKYIIRGIRSEADFRYEYTIRQLNGDIAPEIETVFLIPPRELAEVSSSIVKGLAGADPRWEDTVGRMVPACVLEALRRRHKA